MAGWGDADGIEGNYSEDDEKDESREANETNETSEVSETSSTNETNQGNETNRTSETKETKEKNIKEEWNGRTIYLPDTLLDEMEDTYLETQLKLRRENVSTKKSRHFYPLLVKFGINALAEADGEEIADALEEIE